MRVLIHLAVLTGTFLLASRFIAGVKIKNPPAAVLVAVVFGAANWLLSFPLKLLLSPLGFLTLGLGFLVLPLIVNAILLWLTDKVLKVFELEDAKALGWMTVAITAVNAVFHLAMRR